MQNEKSELITLYTSRWCAHSMSVERFVKKHDILVELVNIDGDSTARQALIQINDGYASVPTLVFPDGTKLTEPSLSELRRKLQMEPAPSFKSRIKDILSKSGE